MKQISLSELSLEMGVNKSMLAYYSQMGLIKPMSTVGRMKIFDYDKTVKILNKIGLAKKEGKTLGEIKKMK